MIENITLVDCVVQNCSGASFGIRTTVHNIGFFNCKAIDGAIEGFDLNGDGTDSYVYLEDCKAIRCKYGYDCALDGNFTLKHCIALNCEENGFAIGWGEGKETSYLIGC